MKKLFTIVIAAVLLITSANLNAQDKTTRIGVKGGLNISNVTGSIREDFSGVFKSYTGFHAGIVLNVKLPLGFAFQPELIYSQNGTKIESELLGASTGLKVGSIQLPLGIQWGIKLGPVRPYATVVPYIGYALSHNLDVAIDQETLKKYWNAFDWGVGVGVGIDIWKFQVSAKYNWALGNLAKDVSESNVPVLDDFDKSKIAGLEISLAFLF
jgi:opacity protein-like surface antigen